MMENLLSVLLLLSALAAPGYSLLCLECIAKDSTCKGISKACYDACGLIYQETTEDGKTTRDYVKLCMYRDRCNNVVSNSFIGGTRRIGISCCYTDNCTPSLPKLPTNSPKANGVTCPTCREKNRSYCSPVTDIKCSGDEKTCLRETASASISSDEHFAGCGTSCDNWNIYRSIASYWFSIQFDCRPKTSTGKETPLSCFQCAKTNAPCKGFSVTCLPEHSCGLVYREIIEGGKVYKDYIKSCIPTDKCNIVGSITYALGKMKIGISCCDTDNCTPLEPQWPIDSTEANGLSCPTCRDAKNSKCNPETELPCTGSEQACIYQITEKTGFKESVMGCGTQSLCDIERYTYKNDPSIINMEFTCDSKTVNTELEPASNSLICVICTSEDALECEGALEFCPSNYVCASSYRTTITSGKKEYSIVRSCVPEDKCTIHGTMSVTGRRMAVGVSCCKEGGCIPPIPQWKTKLEKSNGVKCKTCVSSESDSCESDDTMECKGDENKCVNYAITRTSEFDSTAFSFHGCGTKTLCNGQNYSMTNDNVEQNYIFTCA